MGSQDLDIELEKAFDRIEGTVLPGLSAILEGLLDTMSAETGGRESATAAADLHAMGLQLEEMIHYLETCPCNPVNRDIRFATTA